MSAPRSGALTAALLGLCIGGGSCTDSNRELSPPPKSAEPPLAGKTGQPAGPKDKPATLGDRLTAGMKLMNEGKLAQATETFKKLLDNDWDRMNVKGRHGTLIFLTMCMAMQGRTAEADRYGAMMHDRLPQCFVSLQDLSNRVGDDGLAPLRKSVRLCSILVGGQHSMLYVHNASPRQIRMHMSSDKAHTARFDYKSKNFSATDVKLSSRYFLTPQAGVFELPAKGGRLLVHKAVAKPGGEDIKALVSRMTPHPLCLLSAEIARRQPGLIHPTLADYEQTLYSMRASASKVEWGRMTLSNVVLLDYKKPQ